MTRVICHLLRSTHFSPSHFSHFSHKPLYSSLLHTAHIMSDIADETMKIGTHNGTFHCDEVLACVLLKLLPRYKNATVVR